MMDNPRHGIFFVGYADPDTPGGRLKLSRSGEKFLFSESAGEVEHHCEVREFDLTAHAQREDLLEFVSRVRPRTVVLGHGDAEARRWFAEQITLRHPEMKVLQPGPAETVEV
jgi:Cft2 family RNA processing exonuclease